MLGTIGKRKDTVINFECHVHLWLRCPRVQLMERGGSALGRGIRLLAGWSLEPGWTCRQGDWVGRRELDALPGLGEGRDQARQDCGRAGQPACIFTAPTPHGGPD